MLEFQKQFEPARYLTRINGSEYLEVKWRLVWFRAEHPEGVIETELVSLDPQNAVFRARVTIPDGGSATGWGTESPGDFRDYVEKAETKALGRALAALGYGTQFCPDYEFGAAEGRVVDSPVRNRKGRNLAEVPQAERPLVALGQPVTDRQLKFINAIAQERGLDGDALAFEIEAATGKQGIRDLDRRDASLLIDRLQARTDENAIAS